MNIFFLFICNSSNFFWNIASKCINCDCSIFNSSGQNYDTFSDTFSCLNCITGTNEVKLCYASPSLDNQYGLTQTCSKLRPNTFWTTSKNLRHCARQWVLSSSADFSDSFLCVMNCFMGPNGVKPCYTSPSLDDQYRLPLTCSKLRSKTFWTTLKILRQCARQWVLSSSADFSDSFLCVMNCFMGPNGVKPCYASPSLDNQYGHVRTCSKLK